MNLLQGSEEIIQYQWFVNQQQNKSLKNLLKLKSLKLKQLLKKLFLLRNFIKKILLAHILVYAFADSPHGKQAI